MIKMCLVNLIKVLFVINCATVFGNVNAKSDFLDNTFRVNYYKNLYMLANDVALGLQNYSYPDFANLKSNGLKDSNQSRLDREFTIVIHSTNETTILERENAEKSPSKGNNTVKEDALLRLIASKFLSSTPPLLASTTSSVSPACKLQLERYMNSLKDMQLWAFQMYDAGAKMSSGLLNGNVNQYGDFDLCLAAKEGDFQSAIRGQYCIAYLQTELTVDSPKLKRIHSLIQSHNAFRSEFDDPGHRVPRFSTINWGLCLPSGCSHLDLERALRDQVANLTLGTGIKVKVRVEEEMCQVSQTIKEKIDEDQPGSQLAIGFFAFILAVSILMTIYDCKTPESENKNEWLTTFSLKKNFSSLFSLKRERDDIPCIHGIRFVNAFMLILAHKSMALFFQPYVNRTEMTELLGKPWTVIGRAASLYTDPFIMLSGLLTTYSLYGKLRRGNSINIKQEYVGRFLRIVPTLGALILFCTYVLPLIGSGPQWNLVISHHSIICKKYWWRNLLFIHNYFGFENMCLTHTHHVGIDTQLFLTAPFWTIALFKWPRRTLKALLAVALISTVGRYYITITKNLSNYVFFGTSVSQLFATADYMYILPAYRLTVYLMGVALGYFLRLQQDKPYKLSSGVLKIGWYLNIALMLAAFFGPAPMGSLDYIYSSIDAGHYAALAPIGWCSFFGWIIYTAQMGHSSFISRLFSWKGFIITTRLSYAIYLTQFPVFFFNVGKTRNSDYYEFFRMTINLNELLWIAITSIGLTIFFDTPFGNIKKLLFKRRTNPSPNPGTINNNIAITKNQNLAKSTQSDHCDPGGEKKMS